MNVKRCWTIRIILALAATPAVLYAQMPVGNVFTYQGQLKSDGVPFDGNADFEFTLWDDPTSTDPVHLVAGPILFDDLGVERGLFTAELDFGGNYFTGGARWLQAVVNGSTLDPRQPINAAPYALVRPVRARRKWWLLGRQRQRRLQHERRLCRHRNDNAWREARCCRPGPRLRFRLAHGGIRHGVCLLRRSAQGLHSSLRQGRECVG